MPVKPIPEGYHSVSPYLAVRGADRLLDFVKKAFGAQELHRMVRPDGTIWHAEVKIGDSIVMLAEPQGQWKPMPSALYLYVPDVDVAYHLALQAGATSIMEPADQFYGDRNGGVQDPTGNLWWISTHKEDVAPDELLRRAAAYQKKP
jgi:uncharacterized glyoxalase superfamily protein PhnB